MTELLALFVGAFLGVVAMAILSTRAYEKGAADERAKLWRAVGRRDS